MERLEIIYSGQRRRFSKEMKLQIVAESYSEPGLCATTARRHGISRSQLYEWRRLARAWQLDVASPVGGVVPALLVSEVEPAAESLPNAGRMEVVSVNGRRVIVDRDVDVEARVHFYFQQFETAHVLVYSLAFVAVMLVVEHLVIQRWEAHSVRWKLPLNTADI